jgi:hypothetical protein
MAMKRGRRKRPPKNPGTFIAPVLCLELSSRIPPVFIFTPLFPHL